MGTIKATLVALLCWSAMYQDPLRIVSAEIPAWKSPLSRPVSSSTGSWLSTTHELRSQSELEDSSSTFSSSDEYSSSGESTSSDESPSSSSHEFSSLSFDGTSSDESSSSLSSSSTKSTTSSTADSEDSHQITDRVEADDIIGSLDQGDRKENSKEARDGSNNMRSIPSDDPHVLNIHIVAHTHDDVGWLKTVDQYYHGLNNTIQHAAVKYILTSTISALQSNPSRTFTYVEMAFFTRWYTRQTPQTQDLVKSLVRNGQLHFANGGWCMHDEAATHYMGMIDQTTLGHNFLSEEFEGYTPTVGWQLDPFGHSVTQAKVMSYEMGFDALFFGRIDYQDLEKRKKEGRCEGLWGDDMDDDSDEEGRQVFWGLSGSFNGNYQPPPTFDFNQDDEPFIEEVNIDQRVADFVNAAADVAQIVQGHNIMFTMGSDFQYENAAEVFDKLDDLIHFVSLYQQQDKIDLQALNRGSELGRFTSLKVFYSSPDVYAKAKYEEELEWERKTDDFFPYADCKDCYWTGYFTSRPALKRMERVASSFLHMARQVDAHRHMTASSSLLSGYEVAQTSFPPLSKEAATVTSLWNSSPLFTLDAAVGVAQHHDGVSGTSKQHVAYDYAMRMDKGVKEAASYVMEHLENVLGMKTPGKDDAASDESLKLVYCHNLNVTVCNITQSATMDVGTDIYIVAYNALATSTREDNILTLRIPVSIDATYEVDALIQDNDGGAVSYYRLSSVLVPSFVKAPSPSAPPADYVLHIHVASEELILFPPVGARVLCVRMVNTQPSALHPTSMHDLLHNEKDMEAKWLRRGEEMGDNDTLQIENGMMRVIFNTTTGMLSGVYHNKNSGNDSSSDEDGGTSSWVYTDLNQQWGYYTSYQAKKGQKSGAYIFRPSSPDQPLVDISNEQQQSQAEWKPQSTMYKSNLLTEVHTSVSPWVTQITRVCHQSRFIEVEYTVGPIPDDDGVGREVVTRYQTSVDSQDVFYTDSNGREFVKRQRNVRPTWDLEVHQPIAGNYYPVNTAIFIESKEGRIGGDSGKAFGVLTDRTQGGASLSSGAVELMVHRRTKVNDDERGVGEPMDETDGGMTPYPPYGNATRMGKGLVVSGIHKLFVGDAGAQEARGGMDGVFSPMQLFFTTAEVPSRLKHQDDRSKEETVKFEKVSFSSIQSAVAKNVMLMTFAAKPTPESNNTNTFLVRLGHQYDTGEGTLAVPVHVDLSTLFPSSRQIDTIVEKTLSGNQNRSSWVESKFSWKSKSGEKRKKGYAVQEETPYHSAEGGVSQGAGCAVSSEGDGNPQSIVILRPMKICTFIIKLRPIDDKQAVDMQDSLS